MDGIEIAGAILALLYLLFAMKENPLCWLAAIVSSVLYVKVFSDARLYTEAFLQFFFIVLSLQGLRRWWKGGTTEIARVKTMSLSHHLCGFGVTLIASFTLGLFVSAGTDSDLPYLDSAITCFSIYTTFLVTEKYIENWLYWVVIDLIACWVYCYKGLYPTAILFFLYVILAVKGYFVWLKTLSTKGEQYA